MGAERVPSGMITSTRLPSSAIGSSARASSSLALSALSFSVVDPCPMIMGSPCAVLYTAEGAKAPVHRHYDAVDEARAGAAQPDKGADQVLRLAEPSGRRVVDDRLAARGQRVVLVEQERAVLLADEESGCDRVDPHPFPEGARQLRREPAGGVLDPGLRNTVADYARHRPLRRHRRDVDD